MTIIKYDQLKELMGGSSAAEVIVRLKRANVKFVIGKRNRPFTTVSALDEAMGVSMSEWQSSMNLVNYNAELKLNDIEIE